LDYQQIKENIYMKYFYYHSAQQKRIAIQTLFALFQKVQETKN